MHYKNIKWSSTKQFDSKLNAYNLTKLRYGFDTQDYVVLTNQKEHTELYLEEEDVTVMGNNTHINDVAISDRYDLHKLEKSSNALDEDLYLQNVKYADFFNGYAEKGAIESVTITNDNNDKDIHSLFDEFFSALTTDINIDDNELQNLVYGFYSFSKEYHIHRKISILSDVKS